MNKKLALIALLLFPFFIGRAQPGLKEDLSLKNMVQAPRTPSAHPPVLILLHGYGSNEQDLFGLKPSFPDNCLVVSARAPYPIANGGYQWYDLSDQSGHDEARKEQIGRSTALVVKFIAEVVARYHGDPRQVYLIGFSQGAMMCYQVGLTSPQMLKGIGVLSGRLDPPAKQSAHYNNTALKNLRIFISHGTADNRIPFAEGKAGYEYLLKQGLKPEFHEYPGMGHTISNDVIADLVNWLKK